MILVLKDKISLDDFENLLESTKNLILKEIKNEPKLKTTLNGISFEDLVYTKMLEARVATVFEHKLIEHTGNQTFPDIIIPEDKIGIEVKFTNADKWDSTGNSILETTRRKDIERVYIFFGKVGGIPDIKYRRYQDCLSEIVVTHSPRYVIDMLAPEGDSIFNKMKITYDEFRLNNPIKHAQNFYRSQLKEGETLWWISADETADVKPNSFIIKNYNTLDRAIQVKFIAETMILFPELFSPSSRTKFNRASAYLISKYGAVHPGIRDIYTAGGQTTINIKGKSVKVPHIFKELQSLAKDVKNTFSTVDLNTLNEYWEVRVESRANIEGIWIKMVEQKASKSLNGVAVSDIYH